MYNIIKCTVLINVLIFSQLVHAGKFVLAGLVPDDLVNPHFEQVVTQKIVDATTKASDEYIANGIRDFSALNDATLSSWTVTYEGQTVDQFYSRSGADALRPLKDPSGKNYFAQRNTSSRYQGKGVRGGDAEIKAMHRVERGIKNRTYSVGNAKVDPTKIKVTGYVDKASCDSCQNTAKKFAQADEVSEFKVVAPAAERGPVSANFIERKKAVTKTFNEGKTTSRQGASACN
jgi:hypothetical protein